MKDIKLYDIKDRYLILLSKTIHSFNNSTQDFSINSHILENDEIT